jgi:hypothetical protein
MKDVLGIARSVRPAVRVKLQDGGDPDTPQRPRFNIAPRSFERSQVAPSFEFQPIQPGMANTKNLEAAFDRAIAKHLSMSEGDRISNVRAAIKKLEPYLGTTKNGDPIQLLTKNKKLEKAEKTSETGERLTLPDGRGIQTTGLSLSPDYREGNLKLCPNSASCRGICLGKSAGQYGFSDAPEVQPVLGPKVSVRQRAMNRTLAFLREPEAMAVRLYDDIERAKRMADMKGDHLGVRLNTLSDLPPQLFKSLIHNHPDVSFYDYTKMKYEPIADNHHLTYSSTGLSQEGIENPNSNWKHMRQRLDNGDNVAMVFSHRGKELPHTVHDQETGDAYQVVDGRWHDFRPLDIQPHGKKGVIVGLSNLSNIGARDRAHLDNKGFFVHYDPAVHNGVVNVMPQKKQMTGMTNDGQVEGE